MPTAFALFSVTILPRVLPSEEIPLGPLIAELVIAFLLIVFMFLIRQRFLKLLSACGAEVCLFLACKLAFGPDSLITQIMCWLTAIVACSVTVSIVNRINWGNLRGKPQK